MIYLRKIFLTLSAIIEVALLSSCKDGDSDVPSVLYDGVSVDNGTVWHLTVADSSYLFDHADYAVFIPEGISRIRGVLIHQHGCTMEGNGASSAYDIQYQALAKKWSLAIVGPDIYPKPGRNCADWVDPAVSGSGPSLLHALDMAAQMSGCSSLSYAPWLLWGHSGGGHWLLGMVRDYPERIVAACAYSPAGDPQWEYRDEAAQIPILIRHAGANDFNDPSANCMQTALNAHAAFRKMDGWSSIAGIPWENHNLTCLRYMAIPFFESAMSFRLPDSPSEGLKNIESSLEWLGNPETNTIVRGLGFKGDRTGMCRFTDSVTAEKWREYVTTGTVVDHTPPDAPYGLQISRICGNQCEITWKADADMESGIHHFVIYVDGKSVGRLPATDAFQSFDTNGDNALPFCVIEKRFNIIKPYLADECRVSVSTVNHFNLESTKTDIVFNDRSLK